MEGDKMFPRCARQVVPPYELFEKKERYEGKCICSREKALRVGEFRISRAASIWRLQSCAAFICTLQNWMIVCILFSTIELQKTCRRNRIKDCIEYLGGKNGARGAAPGL